MNQTAQAPQTGGDRSVAPTSEDLVREFTENFLVAVQSILGLEAVRRFVGTKLSGHSISINRDGSLTLPSTNTNESIQSLLDAFHDYLTRDFGFEFSEGIFEQIYYRLEKQYPEHTGLVTILNLLPENSLEKKRVHSLSRSALEDRMFERTKELEELNARLETTVVERTQELAKANEELKAQNERLEALSTAKTEFLSLASHQMQAPLTTIKWAIEACQDVNNISKEKLQKNLDTIFESTTRMIGLIRDLLNIARIEEGRFEYNFEKIPVKKVVSDVHKNLGAIAEKRSVALEYEQEHDESLPLVYADSEKLYLALENITENGLKYTPAGKAVKLSMTIEGEEVVIRIQDEGIGIPEADQKKLFTKFFRASNTAQAYRGTGLGLYIVKKIITDHHGKITFESKEGEGTTFFIRLPISY